MNYLGIDYLRRRLRQKAERVSLRYKYYEQKNILIDKSMLTPAAYKNFTAVLGWCAKGVDYLADRLVFDKFDGDFLSANAIFSANNRDVLFDSAILSALISSCCFIYISADEDGYPRLQVLDGSRATGVIDPITSMLVEGYAVLQKGKNKLKDELTNIVTQEAYFTKESTLVRTLVEGEWTEEEFENPAPYPLLVPIIYRPDAKRPLGHSRISRACMNITQSALRTIKRAEISADFYSFPQKYVLGLSEEAQNDFESTRATMSSFLSFGRDEDGNNPSVGQFTQQSMSPYTEQLRTFASLFAGETGLTLDDLGIATDNPSSAEAIKASHENLRLTARKAQRTFGTGFANTGYLAACLRDGRAYSRREIAEMRPIWEPIFETDFSALGLAGDGIVKINTAIPGYFDAEAIRRITGLRPAETEGEGGIDE